MTFDIMTPTINTFSHVIHTHILFLDINAIVYIIVLLTDVVDNGLAVPEKKGLS